MRAKQPVRDQRRSLPLDQDVGHGLGVDEVANEFVRGLAQQHLPGAGGLLEACTDVGRVTGHEGDVTGAIADHDGSRVDPDAHRELDAEAVTQTGVEVLDGGKQVRGRAHRAHRVVLVRRRDAEHADDGVADELLHDAAVALYRGTGDRPVGGEHPAQHLGVQPGAQLGGADQVGEHDRHRLALARTGGCDRAWRTTDRTRTPSPAALARTPGTRPSSECRSHRSRSGRIDRVAHRLVAWSGDRHDAHRRGSRRSGGLRFPAEVAVIVSDVDVLERREIPLREVSGLAVGEWDGTTRVVAVGDRSPALAVARLDAESLPDGWQPIDLGDLVGAPHHGLLQCEAVAVDATGVAVALMEDPARVALVDLAGLRWLGGAALEATAVPGLGRTWADDPTSRGEGVVLLDDGRLLVAKEKKPAGLLEFAVPGSAAHGLSAVTRLARAPWGTSVPDVLAAVAWWPLDGPLEDISDVAVGADGRVYLLSDQSRAIGRLAHDLDPSSPGAAIDALWRLPKKVRKAEGLAFLPDGRALVAVDRPDAGRNLAVLPCLWES